METTKSYVIVMARKPDGTLVKVRKPVNPKSSSEPSTKIPTEQQGGKATAVNLSVVISPPPTTVTTPAPAAAPTVNTTTPAMVAPDSTTVAAPAPTSPPPQPPAIASPPLAFPVPGILNAISTNADALTASINHVNASAHALGTATGFDVSSIPPTISGTPLPTLVPSNLTVGSAPGQPVAAIAGVSPYVANPGTSPYVSPQLIATAATALVAPAPTATTLIGSGALYSPSVVPAQTQQQQSECLATHAIEELEAAARHGESHVPHNLERGMEGGEVPEWEEGMDEVKDDIPEWEEGMEEVMDEEGSECIEVDDADEILEWEDGMEEVDDDDNDDEYSEDEISIRED